VNRLVARLPHSQLVKFPSDALVVSGCRTEMRIVIALIDERQQQLKRLFHVTDERSVDPRAPPHLLEPLVNLYDLRGLRVNCR
jgi:hypothetical protein